MDGREITDEWKRRSRHVSEGPQIACNGAGQIFAIVGDDPHLKGFRMGLASNRLPDLKMQ